MVTSNRGKPARIARAFLVFAVAAGAISAAVVASVYFMTHKPKPQRQKPPATTPLVEVREVNVGDHTVTLSALGTVIPAVEVTVQAQVTGEIVYKHPKFIEGGIIGKGEELLRIEPEDYELAVVSALAQVETAKAELKAEQGRQDVAKHEWELLKLDEESVSSLDKELALRRPQLRQKQAALDAAQAQLEKARLDLSRTKITAPCNAVIRSADVDVGDLASVQTRLATIAGTDAYRVRVSVPLDELKWIDLPGPQGEPGSPVRVHTVGGTTREGRVLSLMSDLGPESRMAGLLVEIKDPLCLEDGPGCDRLMIDEYVDVEILGRVVQDVVSVPRATLRNGSEIWLVSEDEKLDIVKTDVVWTDDKRALVRQVADGTRVVISDLATPVDGMPVQVLGEADTSPQRTPGQPDGAAHEGRPTQ